MESVLELEFQGGVGLQMVSQDGTVDLELIAALFFCQGERGSGLSDQFFSVLGKFWCGATPLAHRQADVLALNRERLGQALLNAGGQLDRPASEIPSGNIGEDDGELIFTEPPHRSP